MAKPALARQLRFETLDDILAEAKRIAEHSDAPTNGSWTPAQTLWHVGRFMRASVEGYPTTVPFFFRLIGPLFKKRSITKGFTPGIKLPSQAAEHMVAKPGTTMEEALEMIVPWTEKAKAEGFLDKNPMFGPMTRDEWVALHCRHAEMHFGLIDLKD